MNYVCISLCYLFAQPPLQPVSFLGGSWYLLFARRHITLRLLFFTWSWGQIRVVVFGRTSPIVWWFVMRLSIAFGCETLQGRPTWNTRILQHFYEFVLLLLLLRLLLQAFSCFLFLLYFLFFTSIVLFSSLTGTVSYDAGLWRMDCQNMCEVAECNGVQILNVVQFIVESSTYLLNTVSCYGYWWIDFVFFYFPFCFEYLWIRCILTWNVMFNLMVLMSFVLVFQLSVFFRYLTETQIGRASQLGTRT